MHTITLTANNKTYQLESFDIQNDLDSWSYSFNATLLSYADFLELDPRGGFVECSVNITLNGFGYSHNLGDFALIIEQASRDRSDFESYQFSGRGKNALLDKKYQYKISKVYTGVSAQTIATEAAQIGLIALDWQVLDWIVPYYEASAVYPIDIINAMAEAIGAKVQPTQNGGISVIYENKFKPVLIAENSIDLTLNESDILSLSVSFEDRENYDSVEIGNEAIGTNTENASFEWDSETNFLKVFVTPFQSISLHHCMTNDNLTFQYHGVKTETINDIKLAVTDGKANLSKPFYGLLDYDYFDSDLGALTILENGELSTAVIDNSLIDIEYTTKYHLYKAFPKNGIESALVWANETGELVNTPDWKRISVNLGTTDRPAEPITEPLLNGSLALMERGKALLYHECKDRYILNIELVDLSVLAKPSDTVKILESSHNVTHYGILTALSLSVASDSINLSANVECLI